MRRYWKYSRWTKRTSFWAEGRRTQFHQLSLELPTWEHDYDSHFPVLVTPLSGQGFLREHVRITNVSSIHTHNCIPSCSIVSGENYAVLFSSKRPLKEGKVLCGLLSLRAARKWKVGKNVLLMLSTPFPCLVRSLSYSPHWLQTLTTLKVPVPSPLQ